MVLVYCTTPFIFYYHCGCGAVIEQGAVVIGVLFLFYLCIFNDALIKLSIFFYFRSVAEFSLGLVVDGICQRLYRFIEARVRHEQKGQLICGHQQLPPLNYLHRGLLESSWHLL